MQLGVLEFQNGKQSIFGEVERSAKAGLPVSKDWHITIVATDL